VLIITEPAAAHYHKFTGAEISFSASAPGQAS